MKPSVSYKKKMKWQRMMLLALVFVLVCLFVVALVLSVRKTSPLLSALSTKKEDCERRFQCYVDFTDGSPAPKAYAVSMIQRLHPAEFPNWRLYVLDFPTLQQMWHQHCSVLQTAPPQRPRQPGEDTVSWKGINENYWSDLYHLWRRLPAPYRDRGRYVAWFPHDRVERFEFPILVKTRICLDEQKCSPAGVTKARDVANCARGTSILLKLNAARHFDAMDMLLSVSPDPKVFRAKLPKVVWRGRPTGFGFGNNIPSRQQSREALVRKFGHLDPTDPRAASIDVGLTELKPTQKKEWGPYEKPSLSQWELLKYRYLISIEGNDVASNLKWIMASNSVVFMPRPRIESWFLECRLKPYVHYVPLADDCADLWTQFQWAEAHLDACEKIQANAKAYAQSFSAHLPCEQNLPQLVLQYYLDSFHWTIDSH